MAGDGDDAREGGTATWTLVGTVLGMEVPWMERQYAMATLVREHIENSMVEKLVYESVSVRGMVYELVSGEETLMTLGVEVPLLGGTIVGKIDDGNLEPYFGVMKHNLYDMCTFFFFLIQACNIFNRC
jgi:hypothetical protein